jgi:hypothetical protein
LQYSKVASMPRGGKRRGAGRKKIPLKKTSWYNSRMSAELRAVLEKKASQHSRKLAREIEVRLENSIKEEVISDGQPRWIAERWGTRQNYALARLVGEIARFVNGNARASWRESRFAFECLREAIHESLRYISAHVPREPTSAPPDLARGALEEWWRDPEQLGRFIALSVWRELKEPSPPVRVSTPDIFYTLPQVGQILDVENQTIDEHPIVRSERQKM